MAAPLLPNCQKQQSFGESGDFEEDILDPRIQTELEKLNSASEDINRLELALDEARANFRQTLTESTQQLNGLAKKLGSCIEKARPYYEARLRLKEAQAETQDAALRFDRACSQLAAAKEMVFLAEQGYFKKGQPFDPAWQEMLNHATTKVNETETERLDSELEHQQTASLFNEAEQLVKVVQKDLKRTIAKSRPYFEMKAKFNQHMEGCKKYVTKLEDGVSCAKKSYADALFRLEKISDEIHQLRAEAKLRQEMGDRGMGVGAETPSPPPEETDMDCDTLATNGKREDVNGVPRKREVTEASDIDPCRSLDTTISDDDRTLVADAVPSALADVEQNGSIERSPKHVVSVGEDVNAVAGSAAGGNSSEIPNRTDANVTNNGTAQYSHVYNDSTVNMLNKSTGHNTNSDSAQSKNENPGENVAAASIPYVSLTETQVEEKCTTPSEDTRAISPQLAKSPVVYTNKGKDPAAVTGIKKSTVLNKVRNFEKAIGTGNPTVCTERITDGAVGVIHNTIEPIPRKINEDISDGRKINEDITEGGGAVPQCVALTLTSPDSEKSFAFNAQTSSPDSEQERTTMNTNAEVMERVQRSKDVACRRFLRLRRASHDNLFDEFSDTDSESVASVSMLDDEQVESLMQEPNEYATFLSRIEATDAPSVRRRSLPNKLSHLASYVGSRPTSVGGAAIDAIAATRTRVVDRECSNRSIFKSVCETGESEGDCVTKADGNTDI